ncbi:hypothetical protein SKAU_G00166290 [Synaphobranchus kaupii]|uniref:Uncharacterized protein n=1 Tax=Synaphobranchus kaupii TaxID=118154 RepID=A0A9Q1IY54_SYNKA|nr:hypothetical protein SKAU_G00166290 [Synaphobranchus kaupii]
MPGVCLSTWLCRRLHLHRAELSPHPQHSASPLNLNTVSQRNGGDQKRGEPCDPDHETAAVPSTKDHANGLAEAPPKLTPQELDAGQSAEARPRDGRSGGGGSQRCGWKESQLFIYPPPSRPSSEIEPLLEHEGPFRPSQLDLESAGPLPAVTFSLRGSSAWGRIRTALVMQFYCDFKVRPHGLQSLLKFCETKSKKNVRRDKSEKRENARALM